jgi:hypothetical protein
VFDLVHQFFRLNEACDEAIGHVLDSVDGDLDLLDENDCVGAGVASGHALKSADLFSIRMGKSCFSYRIGYELLVFEELASLPNNRVGYFTEPHNWETA